MEIRFIRQAIALLLIASSITAGRVNLRHRKRGILNHARFSAYSIGHPAPPIPISYALRHGGASVASYSATYPRFRKIVLQTPVAVGQKPVHFDEGYVNVVRPAPVLIQRPVYPVAVQNHPPSYYPGSQVVGSVYPSVDLHPSTVVADSPQLVGYPSTIQAGQPSFVPLSPRPVVETPQYVPQYPSFVASQVPSALRPGHLYPANTFSGNPVVPAVPVLPPVSSSGTRPFYTLRPGVFPVIPGVYSMTGNEDGTVSSQPRPDNQPGQNDYQPQYPTEESYPHMMHHNQQPDTGYYTPTSTGSGSASASGVYLTPTSGGDTSGGGQGSTSQQSPWTPMHPVDDSATDYHQVGRASTPAISLLPPYHSRYQHQQQQEQRYSAPDDYADY